MHTAQWQCDNADSCQLNSEILQQTATSLFATGTIIAMCVLSHTESAEVTISRHDVILVA